MTPRFSSAARSAFANVEFEGVANVALVAGLGNFEQVPETAQEFLANGLRRGGGPRPVRNEFLNVPLRHGAD